MRDEKLSHKRLRERTVFLLLQDSGYRQFADGDRVIKFLSEAESLYRFRRDDLWVKLAEVALGVNISYN